MNLLATPDDVHRVIKDEDPTRDADWLLWLDTASELVRKYTHREWSDGTANLVQPPVLPATSVLDGGHLTPGTYGYRVTAINASGESLPSIEVTATVGASVPPSNVTLTWLPSTGATGYKVYGRTPSGEQLLATVANVLVFVDDGSLTPSGALPVAATATTNLVTETFHNVRADEFLFLHEAGATVTTVRAYPILQGPGIPLAPPEGYTLTAGVSYQQDGNQLQLMSLSNVRPFEGVVAYSPPGNYQRVDVTYLPAGVVPAPIRDATAMWAVALDATGALLASTLKMEKIEDYQYQVAEQTPMPAAVKGLLRWYTRREVLVT